MNNGASKYNYFHKLPFAAWLPIIYGAGYGLFLRIVYSLVEFIGRHNLDVMGYGFAVGAPLAVGAITVYLAERQSRRSIVFYIFAPMLSVTLFVLGTAVLLIEGAICIAMAMPLFLLLSSLSGLVMGMVCRYFKIPTGTVQSIALLPIVLTLMGGQSPLPNHTQTTSQSIQVAASPEIVWRNIMSPTNIMPEEFNRGLVYHIGVPYPVEAKLLEKG
ncbi:MAG: hypothetical protein ACWGOV_11460, partial [Acidiferrobacterales bacterium]